MTRIGNDPTDPRRLAFLLLIPGVSWALHYLWPDNGIGFWLLIGILMAIAVMLVPLPPWQETPQRRWAVVAMYAVASAAIAGAASLLHLITT